MPAPVSTAARFAARSDAANESGITIGVSMPRGYRPLARVASTGGQAARNATKAQGRLVGGDGSGGGRGDLAVGGLVGEGDGDGDLSLLSLAALSQHQDG